MPAARWKMVLTSVSLLASVAFLFVGYQTANWLWVWLSVGLILVPLAQLLIPVSPRSAVSDLAASSVAPVEPVKKATTTLQFQLDGSADVARRRLVPGQMMSGGTFGPIASRRIGLPVEWKESGLPQLLAAEGFECDYSDSPAGEGYRIIEVNAFEALSGAAVERTMHSVAAPLSLAVQAYNEQELPNCLVVGNAQRHELLLKELIVGQHQSRLVSLAGLIGIDENALQNIVIRESMKKSDLVDQVEQSALDFGVKRRFVRLLPPLVDEMIMNAIFNAPLDPDGSSSYTQLDRSETIELQGHQSAVLSWGISETTFAVSVVDPFGSVSPAVILNYLKHGFTHGEVRQGMGKGGAGLGLYMMARSVNHLAFSVLPGRMTQVIGLIDLKATPEEFKRRKTLYLSTQSPLQPLWSSRTLNLEYRSQCGGHFVRFNGAIDELTRFDALAEFEGELIIDLGGVTRIGSVGVQRWIQGIEALRQRCNIQLEQCPVILVHQINMIANFASGAAVRSFYAPYRCDACDRDEDVLVRNEQLDPQNPELPEVPCFLCEQKMDFDDVAADYLSGMLQKEKTELTG